MKKKIVSVMLCAAMATTVLAGCGSSNTASTDAAAEETTEDVEAEATKEEAEDAEAAEAATDAAEVTTVEPGVLTMGTNATFPPYEYKDGDDVVGIDAEIAQALADKLGLQLEIVDMDFDSLVASVQSGKIDMSLAGMTVTEERKQNVDFTDSYATGVQVIIVKEDSDIASADDLEGKLIGVQQGTTGHLYCSDDFGEDNVIPYANGATAVQALLQGKVDCVVIDQEPAKAFVEANEGLKILETAYTTEDYAAAVSKDNPALTAALNSALQELKDDGTIQGILDKYIKAE
ncbi:MAG: ABC transporter substrate-binding protein [Clostridiaceae bacterium]|nr:ABC transporter substrate-binding protein [Clostridiaceae bacterium]MDD5798097.1 ABC transporter substrate-binding protein [Clostridiaceae bacterium]MDY4545373.1 ABC transporter substrate-binding protein [Candidatus Choladocola sp.]